LIGSKCGVVGFADQVNVGGGEGAWERHAQEPMGWWPCLEHVSWLVYAGHMMLKGLV